MTTDPTQSESWRDADLDILRVLADRIDRLHDNAAKVAVTNSFGKLTAEQCIRESDALRRAIVQLALFESPAHDQ